MRSNFPKKALLRESHSNARYLHHQRGAALSPSIESLKHIADALSVPLRDLFEGKAFPTKEALVHLNRLCREREDEEIELILGIAQLIFKRIRDRSRTP